MGALKIIEGFIGVNENVIDGLVSIVGFIDGIFSSRFQDCLGEFIKKDWVGDTTAKWYEEGWLKNVNKYSYMSHQSTAANVLKGVGNAVGYIALSCIPYVGFAVSTAAATMGAIGSGTQSGLQQGMSYNQAFGQGAKQGAVALATSLITKGIANKFINSNSPMDKATGSKGGIEETRLMEIYRKLSTLRSLNTAFLVATPYGVYENMYIQSLLLRQGENNYVTDIELTMKQINFANVLTTKADENVKSQYANIQQSVEQNKGVSQGTKKSLAASWWDSRNK